MRLRGELLPFAFLALLLAPRPAAAVASGWAVNGPSRVRLITPWRIAPRTAPGKGGDLRLGLHFLLQPEWHVYWKNSGDAGYPPSIAFSGSPIPATGELLWPAPRRFELRGGLIALGYEGEVVYPLRVHQEDGSDSSERWTAEVDYLVCQVDCIPFHSRLTVEQPFGPQAVADPETAPWIEQGWSQLPVTAGTLPGVSQTTVFVRGADGKAALSIDIHGVTAVARAKGTPEADLFLEPQDLFETGRPAVVPTAGGIRFQVPLTPRQSGKPLPATFPFAWTATGLRTPEGEARTVALNDRVAVSLEPTAAPPASRTHATAAGSAVGIAGLAVLSTLLALGLWGLLGAGPGTPATPEISLGRMAAGFLAALGTLGALYLLSRSVPAEGLAGVELALLAMALFAWLHRITIFGSKLSWGLWIALGLSAGAALGCAALSRFG